MRRCAVRPEASAEMSRAAGGVAEGALWLPTELRRCAVREVGWDDRPPRRCAAEKSGGWPVTEDSLRRCAVRPEVWLQELSGCRQSRADICAVGKEIEGELGKRAREKCAAGCRQQFDKRAQ